jgi:hypothetical protein
MTAPARAGVAAAAALALAMLSPAPAVADDDLVVVPRPGVVFHALGSTDVRGRTAERPRAEALASGYAPCPVCYAARVAPVAAGPTVTPGALTSPSRGLVGLPPPLSPTAVTQPFGERCFLGAGKRATRAPVKDPYREPETIRNPGMEQGAYSEPW